VLRNERQTVFIMLLAGKLGKNPSKKIVHLGAAPPLLQQPKVERLYTKDGKNAGSVNNPLN
jgi:hypothetical protein